MRRNRLAAVVLVVCSALAPSAAQRAEQGPSAFLNPGAESCDGAIDMGNVPGGASEPGMMLEPDDIDWRSFRVTSSRLVAVETVGDPLLSDTEIAIFRACFGGFPSLALEVSGDRSESDWTSRAPAQGGRCLEPGTYFVVVGSYFQLGTQTEFELRINDLGPCVLPPRDRFEPDDRPQSAKPIGVGRPSGSAAPVAPGGIQRRTIFPMGDIDVARFTLDEPAMVRVRAASPTHGDTLLGVASAADASYVGVSDDESPSSLAARFESCLPAGSWLAVVAAALTPDLFSYDLSVEKSTRCLFESEPNETRARATTLPLHGSRGIVWGMRSAHAGSNDLDVYRVVVPAQRGVVFETGGYDPFDVDTRIELLDARGSLIAADEDGGDGFLSRIERVLPAGTYYVGVAASPFEAPADDEWVYSLTATVGEPPYQEHEPNDSCASAERIRPPRRTLGALVPAGDQDHFLLTLPPSTMGGFDIEVIVRSTGDPVLEMFGDPDECAFRAACDDDSGDGLDPLVHCCFAGDGAYTLRLRDFQDDDALPAYSIEVKIAGECVPTTGCQVAPDQFGCNP